MPKLNISREFGFSGMEYFFSCGFSAGASVCGMSFSAASAAMGAAAAASCGACCLSCAKLLGAGRSASDRNNTAAAPPRPTKNFRVPVSELNASNNIAKPSGI